LRPISPHRISSNRPFKRSIKTEISDVMRANDAAADNVVVPMGGALAEPIRALQSHASRARERGA
jgi:hypothetical protein